MKWFIFIFILVLFVSCSDSVGNVVTGGDATILGDEIVIEKMGIYYPSFVVNGSSMSPRIEDGTEIFFDVNYTDLKREDVVLFNFSGDVNLLIKQIKGIPNDSFGFDGNRLFINGDVLTNSVGEMYYIDSKVLELFAQNYPIIPENTYLLLGDAVNDSIDALKFGLVHRSSIYAKVIMD